MSVKRNPRSRSTVNHSARHNPLYRAYNFQHFNEKSSTTFWAILWLALDRQIYKLQRPQPSLLCRGLSIQLNEQLNMHSADPCSGMTGASVRTQRRTCSRWTLSIGNSRICRSGSRSIRLWYSATSSSKSGGSTTSHNGILYTNIMQWNAQNHSIILMNQ